MINAIIVEDEPKGQEVIVELLRQFQSGINIIKVIDNAEDATKAINELNPDILFLDIELKLKSAFDILDSVDCSSIQIIFTTAFEKYAIRAIKYAALDYLLKPIDIDELDQAIKKAEERISKKESNFEHIQTILSNLKKPNSRIAIPTIEGYDFIAIDQITHCQADSGYSIFYLKNSKKIVSSKPLKYYQNIVDQNILFRVSKSHLVNLAFIKKYVKGKSPYIILTNDQSINVSINTKNTLLEKLHNK